jgi:hypothetical protein
MSAPPEKNKKQDIAGQRICKNFRRPAILFCKKFSFIGGSDRHFVKISVVLHNFNKFIMCIYPIIDLNTKILLTFYERLDNLK